jgi:hypothetical protein
MIGAMDLTPHISELRDHLLLAAEAGGEEARSVAERLTAALESAFRLALLDALSVATAEITRELAPGSVELRLRGRDPEFVVVVPPAPEVADGAEPTAPAWDDDSPMTRINLRLGQDLKDRVEEAARWDGLSVNAWLVRAAGNSLISGPIGSSATRASARGADRYRGWVR